MSRDLNEGTESHVNLEGVTASAKALRWDLLVSSSELGIRCQMSIVAT